jgi:hypothetical protein
VLAHLDPIDEPIPFQVNPEVVATLTAKPGKKKRVTGKNSLLAQILHRQKRLALAIDKGITSDKIAILEQQRNMLIEDYQRRYKEKVEL